LNFSTAQPQSLGKKKNLGSATPDQAYPDSSIKKGGYGASNKTKKKERSATPIQEPLMEEGGPVYK
jgi:hypothetical protein